MVKRVLAIDKDLEVHERQKQAGAKYGHEHIRVDSMNEAICVAAQGNFLFIAINADNMDFLPMLQVLRSVTTDLIYIITATPTTEERVAAYHNGADAYGTWASTDDGNAKEALAMISRHTERRNELTKPPHLLVHGNLLLMPEEYRAFVNDTEVELTKTEFDILHYLRLNRGIVLLYSQIYRQIWGENYAHATADGLRTHIKRMRKKLTAASTEFNYIETVRNVGYRFTTRTENK